MVQSWFGAAQGLATSDHIIFSDFKVRFYGVVLTLSLYVKIRTQSSQDVHKKYKHVNTF